MVLSWIRYHNKGKQKQVLPQNSVIITVIMRNGISSIGNFKTDLMKAIGIVLSGAFNFLNVRCKVLITAIWICQSKVDCFDCLN